MKLDEEIEVPKGVFACFAQMLPDEVNSVIGQQVAKANGPGMDSQSLVMDVLVCLVHGQ